jgi:site-specific DNA recombinase
MLSTLASRRAAKAATVDERIAIPGKEVYDTDQRLRRLHKLIEGGVTEQDDSLKDRLTALKADRDRAHTALERAKAGVRPSIDISPALIERFVRTMREKLTTGEIPFRKAYLGSIIDRVEVDDHQIRTVGRKQLLEAAMAANGGPIPGVCSLVRKWRPVRVSNPCSQRERLVS